MTRMFGEQRAPYYISTNSDYIRKIHKLFLHSQSFKEAKVVPRKGPVILDIITNELKTMFNSKTNAVGVN